MKNNENINAKKKTDDYAEIHRTLTVSLRRHTVRWILVVYSGTVFSNSCSCQSRGVKDRAMGVMDGDSGENEDDELTWAKWGEYEQDGLHWGWRSELHSWFLHRRRDAYRNERSCNQHRRRDLSLEKNEHCVKYMTHAVSHSIRLAYLAKPY